MNTRVAVAGIIALALFTAGCPKKDQPQTTTVTSASASATPEPPPPQKLDAIPRGDFNRVAAELALPLFWSEDKNKNNALDPEELVVYWGLEPGAVLGEYVSKGQFLPKMRDAYELMLKLHRDGAKYPAGLPQAEAARRDAVRKELAAGKPTLVQTDLSKASSEEKRFVGFIMTAASLIEGLYAKQLGTADLAKKIPADDPASKTLFFRSQGPKCTAPQTHDNKACSAVPDPPSPLPTALYSPEILATDKFCDALLKNKDKAVMDPFTTVSGTVKEPKPVPYNETFKEDMQKIAGQLKAAAGALGEKEPDLKAYILADAQAFEENKWWDADDKWAKMNSKYYLRIAPDENYEEPCSTKALFHVSFALIDQGANKWQEKLNPIKGDMEKALAALAGPPYKARDVQFKLPDFIDVALNAGNSRNEFGATIGQSLPNYGPVSEGHGRTVVMVNLYTDPDSLEQGVENSKALVCSDTMALYDKDPDVLVASTVLHEAAHNLGPSNQYKVGGKVDREVFGGPLAAMLEELKAQTAAMYFLDWLADRKEMEKDAAVKSHVRDVLWMFGHISRGMYDSQKHAQPYSQLSAIQLGWFMNDKAVVWKADEMAANGKDKGCFSVDPAKLTSSIKTLMTEVAQLKASGARPRGEKLMKTYVEADKFKVFDVIKERLGRAPKQSFVYDIKLD
jgi:hypothetical protein